VVLAHWCELQEHKLSRAVWEVLPGTFLLEGHWWLKEKTSSSGWGSISAGKTDGTWYFEFGGGAGSQSQTYEMLADLLGAFVSHMCKA